ncbi:MAG: SGNH/GDSL hydrolase family protein [Candidatus Rokubacteria bacterium]|nr:SGNH/GDSL hydrolase family protein [Candidatus Rokubacteria bacterium]
MKRRLALVVLAVVGAVAPLLALEIGLRVLYPQTRIMTVDERFGSRPQPNLNLRRAYGGHERVVTIRTNALGLRGAETPAAKLPGVKRVLALGDSFTFGDAVELDETWPRRLEARLNESGGPRRVEVVNAGVSGWGTGHQLLFARAFADRLAPDLVVLAFSVVNDVLDNLCVDEATYRPRTNAPCFTVDGGRLRFEPPAPAPPRVRHASLVGGSRVAQLLVAQIKRLTLSRPAVVGLARDLGVPVELPYLPATIASWYDDRYRERGWELTRRLLGELKRTLDARSIPLVVLVVPASVQAEGDGGGKRAILEMLGGGNAAVHAFLADPTKPQRLLRDYCADARVPCVDPLPALLERRAQGDTVYYPLDQHWTPAAHDLAASLLVETDIVGGLLSWGDYRSPPSPPRSEPSRGTRDGPRGLDPLTGSEIIGGLSKPPKPPALGAPRGGARPHPWCADAPVKAVALLGNRIRSRAPMASARPGPTERRGRCGW